MNPIVAILCGGFGTRLGTLTRDVPKPMIPIGGRPYLERVSNRSPSAVCAISCCSPAIAPRSSKSTSATARDSACASRTAARREPLGTGGALREARALLGDRFILTYGDVLRRFDYDRFVQQHMGNCLAVYPRLTIGNADVAEGFVVRFDKRAPELPYVDAGFSVMLRVDDRPAAARPGRARSRRSSTPNLAEHGELEAEIVDHDFFDIGTPDELARTRAALEASCEDPRHRRGRLHRLEPHPAPPRARRRGRRRRQLLPRQARVRRAASALRVPRVRPARSRPRRRADRANSSPTACGTSPRTATSATARSTPTSISRAARSSRTTCSRPCAART